MLATAILAFQLAQPPKPDNASIDACVKALYSTISGAAGEKRDWDRFKNLFTSYAHLSAVVGNRIVVITPQEYVDRSGPYLEKNGFFEKESKRKTEEFGKIASVWSNYESRNKLDDKKPFEKGINAIQLVKEPTGWRIASVVWDSEPKS